MTSRPRRRHGISLQEYRDSMALYSRRGCEVKSARLDREKVRYNRASSACHAALARKYGVAESTIRAVREFRSWKQVR